MRESSGRSAAVLVAIVLVTELVPAGVQALTSASWAGWYQALAKPGWTPPDWVFPVVWPTLYLLMTVAAWLVWRSGPGTGKALALYAVQILVNASWAWIFAGLQSTGGGLVVILLLWPLIVATLLAFRRHSRAAALLLLPYLAWVTFAAALNFAVWRLNG